MSTIDAPEEENSDNVYMMGNYLPPETAYDMVKNRGWTRVVAVSDEYTDYLKEKDDMQCTIVYLLIKMFSEVFENKNLSNRVKDTKDPKDKDEDEDDDEESTEKGKAEPTAKGKAPDETFRFMKVEDSTKQETIVVFTITPKHLQYFKGRIDTLVGDDLNIECYYHQWSDGDAVEKMQEFVSSRNNTYILMWNRIRLSVPLLRHDIFKDTEQSRGVKGMSLVYTHEDIFRGIKSTEIKKNISKLLKEEDPLELENYGGMGGLEELHGSIRASNVESTMIGYVNANFGDMFTAGEFVLRKDNITMNAKNFINKVIIPGSGNDEVFLDSMYLEALSLFPSAGAFENKDDFLKQLPTIYNTDPINMYIGCRPGDLLIMFRRGESGMSSVYVRYTIGVVDPVESTDKLSDDELLTWGASVPPRISSLIKDVPIPKMFGDDYIGETSVMDIQKLHPDLRNPTSMNLNDVLVLLPAKKGLRDKAFIRETLSGGQCFFDSLRYQLVHNKLLIEEITSSAIVDLYEVVYNKNNVDGSQALRMHVYETMGASLENFIDRDSKKPLDKVNTMGDKYFTSSDVIVATIGGFVTESKTDGSKHWEEFARKQGKLELLREIQEIVDIANMSQRNAFTFVTELMMPYLKDKSTWTGERTIDYISTKFDIGFLILHNNVAESYFHPMDTLLQQTREGAGRSSGEIIETTATAIEAITPLVAVLYYNGHDHYKGTTVLWCSENEYYHKIATVLDHIETQKSIAKLVRKRQYIEDRWQIDQNIDFGDLGDVTPVTVDQTNEMYSAIAYQIFMNLDTLPGNKTVVKEMRKIYAETLQPSMVALDMSAEMIFQIDGTLYGDKLKQALQASVTGDTVVFTEGAATQATLKKIASLIGVRIQVSRRAFGDDARPPPWTVGPASSPTLAIIATDTPGRDSFSLFSSTNYVN